MILSELALWKYPSLIRDIVVDEQDLCGWSANCSNTPADTYAEFRDLMPQTPDDHRSSSRNLYANLNSAFRRFILHTDRARQ